MSFAIARCTGVNLGWEARATRSSADFKAANHEALENYGWQDPAKGLVRLKIERAMELTVQQWKNPQEARANLISRVEKATAPPPKPNYE